MSEPNVSNESAARFAEFYRVFRARLEREIVGQKTILDELTAAFFAGESVLLVGAPGLGKSAAARAIAEGLGLSFARIQATPDLTADDVLGSDLWRVDAATGARVSEFAPGPLFSNVVVLADVDRTPPKTQAAFFDALGNKTATVAGRKRELETPFFPIATRTSSEDVEGEFALTDSQIDRFLFVSKIDYPRAADEVEAALRATGLADADADVRPTRAELREYQETVRRVDVPTAVAEYAVKIVRKTRPQTKTSTETTQQYVERGAGPRGSRALLLGAKAFAAFDGRTTANYSDVDRAAPAALRGRVRLNYLALGDGIDVDLLVRKALREVRIELNLE